MHRSRKANEYKKNMIKMVRNDDNEANSDNNEASHGFSSKLKSELD